MIICSAAGCQTSAGCKCNDRIKVMPYPGTALETPAHVVKLTGEEAPRSFDPTLAVEGG
jgi:hypothetical protein